MKSEFTKLLLNSIKIGLLVAAAHVGIALVVTGCDTGNQDTALAQQLDQPSLSPTVGLYIADIQWERITCRTETVGNFAPLVDCDTLIVIQPHAILKTDLQPKPQIWTEQLEPPAQGMSVTKIVRWIKKPK